MNSDIFLTYKEFKDKQRFMKNLPQPNEGHSIKELIQIHNELCDRHEHLCEIHERVYKIGKNANYCGYMKSVKVSDKIVKRGRIIADLATKAYLLWKSKR
jgi:hypothetical protein